MADTVYQGRYVPLQGVSMSQAYASTLRISFDVRGGLIIRQIHHWAALLFIATMLIHMFRVFFTGAFRRPRQGNWLVGIGLVVTLALVEGFSGYSLPDDLLSGTGLRIADAVILSIPVVGTWISFLVFGGPFPGTAIIGGPPVARPSTPASWAPASWPGVVIRLVRWRGPVPSPGAGVGAAGFGVHAVVRGVAVGVRPAHAGGGDRADGRRARHPHLAGAGALRRRRAGGPGPLPGEERRDG